MAIGAQIWLKVAIVKHLVVHQRLSDLSHISLRENGYEFKLMR